MKMKKIISIVLAVSLIFALALTATAVGNADLNSAINGDTSKDVKVTVDGVETAGTLYYVVIEWESLDFTYDFKETGRTWDPENHTETYTEGAAAWTVNTAGGQEAISDGVNDGVKSEITVINHSNTAVSYTAALADGTALDGVNVALSGDSSKTLTTGVGKTFATADKGTFAVSVTGAPTARTEATTTVKTVNITLNAG